MGKFDSFPAQASSIAPEVDHLLYYLLAVSIFFTVLIFTPWIVPICAGLWAIVLGLWFWWGTEQPQEVERDVAEREVVPVLPDGHGAVGQRLAVTSPYREGDLADAVTHGRVPDFRCGLHDRLLASQAFDGAPALTFESFRNGFRKP